MNLRISDECASRLRGSTLIVGCFGSTGVAQLCAELAATASSCELVAGLLCGGLVPIAGADPLRERSDELAGAADVYCSADSRLAVLVLRSAAARGGLERELAAALAGCGVRRLVALGSAHGHERRDPAADPFRYAADATDDARALERLGWTRAPDGFVARGGRFAQRLRDACSAAGTPSTLLFRHCYEGDNVAEAEQMLARLRDWIGGEFDLEPKERPASWSRSYGAPRPDVLY